MNFIYIWRDGRSRLNILLREIRGETLRSRLELEFYIKVNFFFCIKVYIAILSRPFD